MNSVKHRIVSLVPSGTELVCALGAENELIGRSHECDRPVSVRHLPVCSTSRIAADSDSSMINRQVRELLEESLSLFEVDLEQLRELQPTVIVTQSQCEVCAVSQMELERSLSGLFDFHPRVIACRPDGLEDIWEDFRRVGDALGRNDEAEQLVTRCHQDLDAVRSRNREKRQPTVACIEWLEPLMTAGNWVPELVEIAGGTPVLAEASQHSDWIDWQQIRSLDPDVLVIMPCGFAVEQSMREIGFLTQRDGWSELSAVQNRRVFIVDGNLLFNRPGPRIAESAAVLAELLHPTNMKATGDGVVWMRLN